MRKLLLPICILSLLMSLILTGAVIRLNNVIFNPPIPSELPDVDTEIRIWMPVPKSFEKSYVNGYQDALNGRLSNGEDAYYLEGYKDGLKDRKTIK